MLSPLSAKLKELGVGQVSSGRCSARSYLDSGNSPADAKVICWSREFSASPSTLQDVRSGTGLASELHPESDAVIFFSSG